MIIFRQYLSSPDLQLAHNRIWKISKLAQQTLKITVKSKHYLHDQLKKLVKKMPKKKCSAVINRIIYAYFVHRTFKAIEKKIHMNFCEEKKTKKPTD